MYDTLDWFQAGAYFVSAGSSVCGEDKVFVIAYVGAVVGWSYVIFIHAVALRRCVGGANERPGVYLWRLCFISACFLEQNDYWMDLVGPVDFVFRGGSINLFGGYW